MSLSGVVRAALVTLSSLLTSSGGRFANRGLFSGAMESP